MKLQVRISPWLLCALSFSGPQAQSQTPLPPHPDNVAGQFDNGLKYIVQSRGSGSSRVAVYLHVKTGSLNEGEDHSGLAHLVTHMGFAGAKHFVPGQIVARLRALGDRQPGPHKNAVVNYHETVYRLGGLRTNEETIEEALTMLADFAHGLHFQQQEIDKQRDAILDELRSDTTADARIMKAMMARMFEGTRLARHPVGGRQEHIERLTKADLEHYWNTWYRPENMTLIIVGDVDPQEVIAKAKSHLGEFKARAPEQQPKYGEVQTVTIKRAIVIVDPERIRAEVEMVAVNAGRPPVKTLEDFQARLVETVGTAILNRRLETIKAHDEGSFISAAYSIRNMNNEAHVPSVKFEGRWINWRSMLEQAVVELHRATEYGFTEYEFDLIKRVMRSDTEKTVRGEAFTSSQRVADSISSAIGLGNPILSAQQRMDILEDTLDRLTFAQVTRSFRENFDTRNYTYVVTLPGKDEVPMPAGDLVLSLADEAWAKKTQPVPEKDVIRSIITDLPAPGTVVQQDTDVDLNITTAQLSNGAVFHHRFMENEPRTVAISITFVGGTLEETALNRGVGRVAGLIKATSKWSSEQIADFRIGKDIRVNVGVGLDTALVYLTSSSKHVEDAVQLAHGYLTDGKVEQQALDEWKRKKRAQLRTAAASAQGQLSMAMGRRYYGNDPRFLDLTPAHINRLSTGQGERWLKRIVNSGAVEVAFVGDITLERALDLACRYVGCLPQRSPGAWQALDPLRRINRGPGPYTEIVHFDSRADQAYVAAGFVGAPLNEVTDGRRLTLAARIISQRLLDRLREEQKIVRKMRFTNRPSIAVPGTGVFGAGGAVRPDDAEATLDLIIDMIREFGENGPTKEELTAVKTGIVAEIERDMGTVRFWAGQLREFKYRNRSLDELKELPDVYEDITAEQLKAAVKKYATDENMLRFAAISNPIAPPESEDTEEEMSVEPPQP